MDLPFGESRTYLATCWGRPRTLAMTVKILRGCNEFKGYCRLIFFSKLRRRWRAPALLSRSSNLIFFQNLRGLKTWVVFCGKLATPATSGGQPRINVTTRDRAVAEPENDITIGSHLANWHRHDEASHCVLAEMLAGI